MLVLITYDINVSSSGGQKRLRNIAKTCLDYGIRVQFSVFECEVTPAQFENLKHTLLKIYDESMDSLRFYQLGSSGRRCIEHYGTKVIPDVSRDVLIL